MYETPWQFQQIKPQKCRGKFYPDLWNNPLCIVEEKFDGDRRIAQFCGNVIRFTGCRESVDGTGFVEKTANLPHLNCQQNDHLIGTVLDGEIVFEGPVSGGRSKYVTAVMGSLPDVAYAKQLANGFLKYYVFDCLYWRGLNIRSRPLKERKEYMANAVSTWGNPDVYAVKGYQGASKTMYDEIVANGGEGVVIKRLSHQYGDETQWVKVKKEATADVVIIGFTVGKGKYTGQVGAIIFGQMKNGVVVEVGQCSGMTDELRSRLNVNMIGKVMRIKHNGREPTGRFRHPRFDGFRDDKTCIHCVWYEGEV